MDFHELPQHDDADHRFQLTPKKEPPPMGPRKPEVPPELQFMARAEHFRDLAPLVTVFQKHPHIRDAVITALRDEGIRF